MLMAGDEVHLNALYTVLYDVIFVVIEFINEIGVDIFSRGSEMI